MVRYQGGPENQDQALQISAVIQESNVLVILYHIPLLFSFLGLHFLAWLNYFAALLTYVLDSKDGVHGSL